ncbi:hypothetical protein [Dulcicalothrix desertica]|nr:hypothetical protein [Dulcicalothrix desertica]
MPDSTTYIEACNNFDKIYEQALSTREPVVVTLVRRRKRCSYSNRRT